MLRQKSNYTMEEAFRYGKNAKKIVIFLGIFFFFFAFIPPLAVLDPRIESHIMPFYAYLSVYYLLFTIFLGRALEKQKKIRAVILEKAILLGCPLEITAVSKGSKAYRSTVLINEAMLALLKPVRREEEPEQAEESVAMKKEFVLKLAFGSTVSEKFIGKNIPHFEKARKIGEFPVAETK